MQPSVQILLSGALTFGVPLVLAVRELMVTGRGGGGAGWRDPTPEPAPPRLPPCLVPNLPPLRTQGPPIAPSTAPGRVRELA